MKIIQEMSLSDVFLYSLSARFTVSKLEEDNLIDEFEELICRLYPQGITDGALNRLLGDDAEWIFTMLRIMPL